jgi:type I restriction enzyme S subunit
VEWLGAVPGSWSTRKARWVCEIKKRIAGKLGFDVLSITQKGVRVKDTESNDGQISMDYSKYQLVEPGDFAMNHMDLLTGFVDVSPVAGVTSPDYRVFSIRDTALCEPRYFLYLFQNGYTNKIFYAYGQGSSQFGRWRMPTEQFNDFIFPLPTPNEQRAISTFLDRETAKIDALVEEQQRLIELLKEKRQAVISQAVTKGLDPNVPMKDSGVEWLGLVPAHWTAVQVGRLCSDVSDGPHFSPTYVDDGVMFLSARNIGVEAWHLEDAKFISERDYIEFSKRIVPELGDVLYTKGGTTGVARVVDLPIRFQVWVHVAVLKLHREVASPYFVAHALNSLGCYEQAQLHTRGATNQDLGLTRMVKIWLALPPLAEQLRIELELNSKTARIDALASEAQAALSLLQERRAALISAAVTGKIDVRGFA